MSRLIDLDRLRNSLTLLDANAMIRERKERMSWQERIVTDPDILVGKPVVRGTRLAVEFVIDLMAQGWSELEILRNYPGLTYEDIQACLIYRSNARRAQKA